MNITIYNLDNFTAQQVFDKVATHLLAQGKQAMNGDNCVYRAPNGLKCAIGCLIPDESYASSMEGTYSEFRQTMTHNELLQQLQNIHDEDSSPDKWRQELTELAETFNLNTNAIGESL